MNEISKSIRLRKFYLTETDKKDLNQYISLYKKKAICLEWLFLLLPQLDYFPKAYATVVKIEL
jgi:hypothetical protein